MEQNTAWAQINSGSIEPELYRLVLPIMQCGSSGIAPGENRISYVANAGPLNLNVDTHPFGLPYTEFGRPERPLRDAKMYTIFFDNMIAAGPWAGITGLEWHKMRVTVDNIASMDGTSMTILLSENEDAGHWIWYSRNPGFGVNVPIADAVYEWEGSLIIHDTVPSDLALIEVEGLVGFSFPNNFSSIATGEIPTYIPLQFPFDNENQPLFINEGRMNSGNQTSDWQRKARPSSGHPGVVVAAFVDGGVRPLKDDMDKTLFVRLARPGSGVIVNPGDLGW